MSVIIEITAGLYSRAVQYVDKVLVASSPHAEVDAQRELKRAQRRLDAAALRFSAAQLRKTGEANTEEHAKNLEVMALLIEEQDHG